MPRSTHHCRNGGRTTSRSNRRATRARRCADHRAAHSPRAVCSSSRHANRHSLRDRCGVPRAVLAMRNAFMGDEPQAPRLVCRGACMCSRDRARRLQAGVAHAGNDRRAAGFTGADRVALRRRPVRGRRLDRPGCDGARRRNVARRPGQPIDPATAGRDADRDQLRRLACPLRGREPAAVVERRAAHATDGHDDVARPDLRHLRRHRRRREDLVDRHPDRHQRRGNRPASSGLHRARRSTSRTTAAPRTPASSVPRPSSASPTSIRAPPSTCPTSTATASVSRATTSTASCSPPTATRSSHAHQAVDIEFDPAPVLQFVESWNELIAIPSGTVNTHVENDSGVRVQDQFISANGNVGWVHGVEYRFVSVGPGPAFPCDDEGVARRVRELRLRRLRHRVRTQSARSRSRASVGISLWIRRTTFLPFCPVPPAGPVQTFDRLTGAIEAFPDNSSLFLPHSDPNLVALSNPFAAKWVEYTPPAAP